MANAEMQEMRPGTGKGNAKGSEDKVENRNQTRGRYNGPRSNEVRSMTLLGATELRNGNNIDK